MRIRSAKTLVFLREEKAIVGYNYLTRSTFFCSHDLLIFLALIDEWTDLHTVRNHLPYISTAELERKIDDLIAVHAVIPEDSDTLQEEDDFIEGWHWGMPAALLHMTVQDRPYLSIEQSEALQVSRLATGSQPSLCQWNDEQDSIALNWPLEANGDGLLGLMARRRTVRSTDATAISIDQLSDCLFAGLGITGVTKNGAGVTLPLGMTPSGGARNPYEAFVYARSVDGLAPGFYHYSALQHSLSQVLTNETPLPSELLGGQDWVDDMPCLIVLCAYFERPMWKYHDANAYRVVLIEAGHIGQNVMLAATNHGLCACPSAALDHSKIARCLGLGDDAMRAPIYAMTLAKPGESENEVIPLRSADLPTGEHLHTQMLAG